MKPLSRHARSRRTLKRLLASAPDARPSLKLIPMHRLSPEIISLMARALDAPPVIPPISHAALTPFTLKD